MSLNTQQFNRLKSSLVLKQQEAVQQSPDNPKGYFQRLTQGFVKESLDIGQSVERGAELMGQGKPIEGAIRSGLGGAGGFVRIAFSPITEALAPMITPLVQKATSGQTAQDVLQKIDTWAKENPDVSANLKNIIDIGTSLIGAKGIKATTPIVGKAGLKTLQTGAKGVEKTGGVLKGAGKSAYGITITPQEATVRALVAYDKTKPTLIQRLFGSKSNATKPITEADTAARQGLMGTEYQIGVQGSKIGDELFKTKISPKLEAVKNAADMRTLISNVSKKIEKVADLGRKNDLKEALNVFKDEYRNVSIIGGTKLQKYKEGWMQFKSDKALKTGKPIANAYKEIQDMMSDEVRPILYKIVGEDGKQAYFDYGNLKSITEAGIKSRLADPAKRSIFRNVWQGIMDKAITPIATTGGKVLYRTGEGLEFIGEAGARKIKDIIK